MSDTSILNLIIEAVNNQLVDKLQTSILEDDPARAGLVRLGLLQDDPTDAGINILTHTNDRQGEDKWVNSVTTGYDTSLGIYVPPFEIGGGEMWWRRFTTELLQFWPEAFDRDTARQYANLNISRVENAIKTAKLVDASGVTLVDTFDESAIEIHTVSSRNTESGGPDQFIWRGKIWWMVLTNKG